MTTTWEFSSDAARVLVKGMVEEPLDGEEPTPFEADVSPAMLTGIGDFLAGRQPWDLWVGAGGEFLRDQGRCAVEALQFGWSTWDGVDVVQLVATVRHERCLDVTANEPQVMVTFAGEALDRLRADIARLRADVAGGQRSGRERPRMV